MRFRVLFFLPALFFPCTFAIAQEKTDSVPGYLESYITDSRRLLSSPLHWQSSDVEKAVLFAGSSLFLMVNDEKINDLVGRNQSVALNNVLHYGFAPFGNGLYALPVVGVLYLSGSINSNEYDRQMAALALKTWTISAGGSTVSKWLFQRNRPGDAGNDAFTFQGPLGDLKDDGSFISRHACTAFALATVLSEGYKHHKRWVPWVAYSVATLVAVSRIYEQEHWTSDAFAGALSGYITGRFLFRINKNRISYRHQNLKFP